MTKLIAGILVLALSSACATNPGLNCDEGCALRDMKCSGTTLTSGSARTMSSDFTVYNTSASSESYACEKPKDATESAAIGLHASNASQKIEAAKKSSTTKTLLLIGGIIITGVASMPHGSSSY